MPISSTAKHKLPLAAALLSLAATAAFQLPSTADADERRQGHHHEDRLQAKLLDHGRNAPLLIAAHRGQWRDAPENSIAAIDAAIDDGAEVVEIDVRRTKDGKLVLMHDETVNRTTNGKGRVADLTLDQVKGLHLRIGLGGAQAPVTNHRVPTLAEAMETVDGRALVNLDKGWPVREDIYDVLDGADSVELGLFKGAPTVDEAAAFMADHPDAHYMHIVDDDSVDQIGEFPGRDPVAYEVVFDDADDPQVQPAALAEIRETSRIWMNSMWDSLAAGLTDEASLRDENLGWRTMTRKYDASMIQTDNVEALDYWRDGGDLDRYGTLRGRRSTRVQGEDFAPGGEGIGYHDLDPNRCNVARPDEDVDICMLRGAVAVNWIRGGEWLAYDVRVRRSGTYLISGRVSSPYAAAGTVILDWGDSLSTPIAIRNTTDHNAFVTQPWQTRRLERGTHRVVLRMPEGPNQNFNLDYLQLDLIGR